MCSSQSLIEKIHNKYDKIIITSRVIYIKLKTGHLSFIYVSMVAIRTEDQEGEMG